MMTDQELQSLRNMGNEAEAAADEIERLREALAAAEADARIKGANSGAGAFSTLDAVEDLVSAKLDSAVMSKFATTDHCQCYRMALTGVIVDICRLRDRLQEETERDG